MSVSVSKSLLTLTIVLFVGLTTVADPASRARHRGQPVHRTYRAVQVPAQVGGGYSSNQRTRELEVLADKYRPTGW
jgi:hypothetical protein